MSAIGNKIMERMGYSPDARGKYIDILREKTERDVTERGLQMRSYGSWGPGADNLSPDEMARARLEWDWEIENGHSYRVSRIDPIYWRRFNVKSGRYHYSVPIRELVEKVGDILRLGAMKLRIFRDKRILGLRNPYSKGAS